MAAMACEMQLDFGYFDVQQDFVQAELKEVVLVWMPQGCGAMTGRVVRLTRSLHALKQASRSWHSYLVTRLKSLGFEWSLADACVFRLIEAGSVPVTAVVHVDDIFAVRGKERCDRFREDLTVQLPLTTLESCDGMLAANFSAQGHGLTDDFAEVFHGKNGQAI